MSFWNIPFISPPPTRFQEQLRTLELLENQFKYQIVKNDEQKLKICHFLQENFGGKKHPILKISPRLKHNEIILYIENNDIIIASIRYRYTGQFDTQSINLIDCFCISDHYRKKGLGSYLLNSLHILTNQMGKKYSIFFKEGPMLPIHCPEPFYTGFYAYRQIVHDIETPNTITITGDKAYDIIKIYREFRPKTFLILNPTSNNQIWRMYRSDNHWIIAVFQNSFQIHPQNDGKIVWCTGLIESIGFPKELRKEAMTQMSELVDYSWVWVDARWIDRILCERWKFDGQFHWYDYQWNSCLIPTQSYCIMGGDEN